MTRAILGFNQLCPHVSRTYYAIATRHVWWNFLFVFGMLSLVWKWRFNEAFYNFIYVWNYYFMFSSVGACSFYENNLNFVHDYINKQVVN